MTKRPGQTDFDYKYLALDVQGSLIFQFLSLYAKLLGRLSEDLPRKHRRSEGSKKARPQNVWGELEIKFFSRGGCVGSNCEENVKILTMFFFH